MHAKHDELWTRLRDALSARGALPVGNATPGEIAAHATQVLPGDAVRRFVHDYYYKHQFGATDGLLSEAEALALVVQVEALPAVKARPATPSPPQNKSSAPSEPKASRPARQPQEALGVSDGGDEPARKRVAKPDPKPAPLPAPVSSPPAPEPPPKAPEPPPIPPPQPAAPSPLESANAKMDADDHQGAVADYEEHLRQHPKDVTAHMNLAYCLNKLGQTQRAIEVASRALAYDPSESRLWNNIGAYADRLERFDDAINAYREAIRLDPRKALFHRNLGRLLQDQKRHAEAAVVYQQAVILDASDDDSRMEAVRCLDKAGSTTAALEAVRNLLERKPDYATARNYLGCLLLDAKDYTNAAVAFKLAADAVPTEPVYWENLRIATERLGWKKAADDAGKRVVSLKPEPGNQRKNSQAFIELVLWCVALWLLGRQLGITIPVGDSPRVAIQACFALVAVMILRIGLSPALRGCALMVGGVAFVIYVDVASVNDFKKLDLGTWVGVLQGLLGGLFCFALNGALLLVPFFLRGRGGKFPV